MAERAFKIGPMRLLGLLSAGIVLALTLGTLAAVALRAQGAGRMGPADWAALRFTLWQATLSAGLSLGVAVPLARALARRDFRGRRALIALMGAPFILPVMVAVLGLLAVFGRGGWISGSLLWAGLEPISIYGLRGILLAHVFFNLPLATRLILQGWQRIPAEQFRLAAALGFSTRDINRTLERPMLRTVLPGAFMVIFLICMTSFAVILALGGGPRATTIELAIYQAFHFDFDLGRAALLASVQFLLGAGCAALALWVSVPAAMGRGLGRPVRRWDMSGAAARLWDTALISAAAAFLIAPLLAIATAGMLPLFSLPTSIWAAAARSLLVALGSCGLTLGLALPLAIAISKLQGGAGRLLEAIGYLSIAASPLVIGTGLFILLFPVADPVALALPVTALVNAVMSLPFALRALVPALRDIEMGYGRLADSLGMIGGARLRLLILPRLRPVLGFSAGLAAALSMGDLGVITLFAAPDNATLPLQLYRLMSAYRMGDAAGAALLLLASSFALFWLFDKGGRGDVDA